MTISANILTDIARPVTNNGYLVEIQTTPVQRFSTVGPVSWNSVDWFGTTLNVEDVEEFGFTFSMNNSDNEILSQVLNNQIQGKTAILYEYFSNAGEALKKQTGRIIGISNLAKSRCTLSVERFKQKTIRVPSVYISPPLFNFLPPRDYVIEWAGNRVKIGLP